MSSRRCPLSKYLAFSMLASIGLCMPSPATDLKIRAFCPEGANGEPTYHNLITSDTCESIVTHYNTSTLDFINVNFLNNNADSTIATCNSKLHNQIQVCVPPPCQTYKVLPQDTCPSIAAKVGQIQHLNSTLALEAYFGYNPGLDDPQCDNMEVGSNVCLQSPVGENHPDPNPQSLSPRSPPQISCTKEYTVISGDTCDSVAAKAYPLTLSDLYALNPSLDNPSCDNFDLGSTYCIANATLPAPLPTQTPSISCSKNYTAVSGDTCAGIAQKANLTDGKAFEALNPEVNDECTNVVVGMSYCVANGTAAGLADLQVVTGTAAGSALGNLNPPVRSRGLGRVFLG